MMELKNNQKEIFITKASGEREVFNEGKLRDSLKRAGASEENIDIIVKKISEGLVDGMATYKIYKMAYALLLKLEKHTSVKYSLRKAIMDLGPSGFPFEDFVGGIFKAMGYSVQVGRIIKGRCVEHEVDLVAHNDKKFITAEIKFHNQLGIKSDLQVALYVRSRFNDLEKGGFYEREARGLPHEGWLITNTKFTESAIQYGLCEDIVMVGWNYPKEGNLQQLVESTGLHPVTALSKLNSEEKNKLLQNNIVFCHQVKDGGDKLLLSLGFKKSRTESVLKEIELLCKFLHKER